MRIVRKLRTTTTRRRTRGYRDLARAMAAAPTRASREELLTISNGMR